MNGDKNIYLKYVKVYFCHLKELKHNFWRSYIYVFYEA